MSIRAEVAKLNTDFNENISVKPLASALLSHNSNFARKIALCYTAEGADGRVWPESLGSG